MSLNVRKYDNKQLLLFPPSIGDYLPDNDLAHVVDEAVDAIDLSPYYDKVSDVGNPPYHPALMIKIWFYGYATRVYSSRKIEDRLHKDVAFIYLAGMQKPDFKAIAEFRRKNLSELASSFVEIVQICHRLGLMSLGEISIDSKVMKANASADRAYTDEDIIKESEAIQKAVERYLDQTGKTDAREDLTYGKDKRGNELPEDIHDKKTRIQKLRKIQEQLKQAQEKLKQSDREKINLTDPDARFQKGSGKIIPGYRAQLAVDSKNQIIVANDVANQENDCAQLVPMVDKSLENVSALEHKPYSEEPIKILADGGYSSGANLALLEKEEYKGKVEPYIPHTNSETRERGKGYDVNSPFHRSKFIYNPEENNFACPAGKKLDYRGKYDSHGVFYHIYENCRDCKNCVYFGKCTTSPKGRRISISEYKPLIDKMRRKLSSQEGQDIYRLRKITVEPAIGNMSYNMGFREFYLRGLRKVKGEFSLMCIAHNLLKIARAVRQSGMNLRKNLKGISGTQPLSLKTLSRPEFSLALDST
jgi:transposase